MSKRLEKRLITAAQLQQLYDVAGMNDLCELLNVSDSYIYTTLKAGECSPMLELAATAIMAEHYPITEKTTFNEIWIVKVPSKKKIALHSILDAIEVEHKLITFEVKETPND